MRFVHRHSGFVKLVQLPRIVLLFAVAVLQAHAQLPCEGEKITPKIRVDDGHPWRPPFGLDRVGRPVTAVVDIAAATRPLREYYLTGFLNGRETERHVLNLGQSQALFIDTVSFPSHPDELVLSAKCRYQGQESELLRQPVKLPDFEADAAATPEKIINPVDLGTILVPADWLLIAAGQKAVIEVAAVSYRHAIADAHVKAWFESSKRTVEAGLSLETNDRAVRKLETGPLSSGPEQDTLHVAILRSDGSELWHKQIRTMFVADRPKLPAFGAIETKLRYDAPISLRDAKSGRLSSMDYKTAWDPALNDVVVALPNGSRFVFWRGSSYIPFWAGLHNTGFSYEWAETTPPPDGFVDSVEPLMDKELRYGRVRILESTPSRIHVRWTYQSTDFMYKVWGDAAAEDYYFYPDGFGTRTLTLQSAPGADYELSEFIILTPQSAYPLEVLPKDLAELIYLDGSKEEVSFPYRSKPGAQADFFASKIANTRKLPIVYRLRTHKEDASTAIYFYPGDLTMPIAYAPFYDRGYLVTPAYWGSHWPLGRGTSTGRAIDDRIYSNPGHNSLLTWGMGNRPEPIGTSQLQTIDTLGKSRPMTIQKWSWLIAMTDVPDERLIDWAQSFSAPPAVDLQGARLQFESYARERRAMRISVEKPAAAITLTPAGRSVDPVFELTDVPGKLVSVSLDGRVLAANQYAWDGHTLWIDATFDKPARFNLRFEQR
jgi:hypothetical protein